MTTPDRTPTDDELEALVEEKLANDLGFDVAAVELEVRLRLDIASMQRGAHAELSYVLIDRQHHPDVAIAYATAGAADAALSKSPLVAHLVAEDSIDIRRPDEIRLTDLAGREIYLPG